MAIPLIYSYHVINKVATQESNNTDMKGNTLVQCFIACEFLVFFFFISFFFVESLYTVTKGRPSQVRKYLLLRHWVNASQDMRTMHVNRINYCVFRNYFIKSSFLYFAGLRLYKPEILTFCSCGCACTTTHLQLREPTSTYSQTSITHIPTN